jgi:tetraacyldisaccharide 4'-kinase
MGIINGEHRHPCCSAASLLWGLSLLYGAATRVRRWGYENAVLSSYRLPCPVISVGNLAVGGTGKTPMVVHLARLIGNMGRRVAILSRGYKGTAQKEGAVVSDGRSLVCDVRRSGDEPYLMAMLLNKVPVVVGKDRWAAGKMALDRFKPDILLLDDAFQHLRLDRDLNLLLLDARQPFGNSYLLPRGRLREPASAINRADAVILTRSVKDAADSPDHRPALQCRVPVFRSTHKPIVRGQVSAHHPLPPLNALSGDIPILQGRVVFAFAGLANNGLFFDSIAQSGAVVQGTAEFDDHHKYRRGDIDDIAQAAASSGADCCITTDKDYVRLSGRVQFPMDMIVMGVDIDFQNHMTPWFHFINARIKSLLGDNKAVI